jgi:hypothetical protein
MKILIAGLAKTGTTGLLYLIANSMGGGPKLLFEPKECPPEGKKDNGADVVAKVIIDKLLKPASFLHFDKKITLVRDPRDRIVSALLYSQFHANYLLDDQKVNLVHECLKRKEADPSSVSIIEILGAIGQATGMARNTDRYHERLGKTLAEFDAYVAAIPDGLLYKYEDFVSGEYAPIEQHLGMDMAGEAAVPDRLNRVVRTKGYGDWRNWFTAEDVESSRLLLSPWLEKYGYDSADWTLNENPVIDPAHCSAYYMRLVEEHRKKPPVNKAGSPAIARTNKPNPAGKERVGKAGERSKPAGKDKIGNIVRADPGVVAGWAIGSDLAKPVEVELLVNGTSIGKMTADKLRPALKERGVHPTGHCGFVFKFGPSRQLKEGDEVAVRPLGEPISFRNSPRRVAIKGGQVEA